MVCSRCLRLCSTRIRSQRDGDRQAERGANGPVHRQVRTIDAMTKAVGINGVKLLGGPPAEVEPGHAVRPPGPRFRRTIRRRSPGRGRVMRVETRMLESALRPPSLPPIRPVLTLPFWGTDIGRMRQAVPTRRRCAPCCGTTARSTRPRYLALTFQAWIPPPFSLLHCSWLLLMLTSTSSVWSRRDRFLPAPIRRPWLFNASRGGLGSSANPPLGRIPL